MRFLRRETGVDVLDLTLLQKKGLLKMPDIRGVDILDLTLQHAVPPSLPSPPAPEPLSPVPSFFDIPAPGASVGSGVNGPIVDNPFGMLDTLANASLGTSGTIMGASIEHDAFNALKLKLEDVEYKLDRLVEKFSLLDGRLTKER